MTMFQDEQARRKETIEQALTDCDGNMREVADRLRVNRGGLYKMCKRMGINIDSYRSGDWRRSKAAHPRAQTKHAPLLQPKQLMRHPDFERLSSHQQHLLDKLTRKPQNVAHLRSKRTIAAALARRRYAKRTQRHKDSYYYIATRKGEKIRGWSEEPELEVLK